MMTEWDKVRGFRLFFISLNVLLKRPYGPWREKKNHIKFIKS